jgi:hypothetical protein
MTILMGLTKPIYFPSGVGTIAGAVKGAKKRIIKRIRKYFIAIAPSAQSIYSEDYKRIAQHQEEQAMSLQRFKAHLCRCADEDELFIMMLEGEDD